VRNEPSDAAARALTASQLARSSWSNSRAHSDRPADRAEVGDRDPLDALVVALADADANVRVDAVSDLGLLRDPQSESLLAITAMQDPAPVVRAEALYALGTRRAESQLAVLQLALDDRDRDVRKAAISALEELGGDASAVLLSAGLSDPDAAIRAAAAEALANIRTAR
jgi:HEAT repeat protein